MALFKLTVDGKVQTVSVDPDTPLLYVLRDELGLNNPRFGCGLAQCGACTVLLNGQAIRSCVVPISAINSEITTLQGIADADKPHPVQQAFIDEQALFCGYCASGWILYAVNLLEKNPNPSDEEIREAFSGLKCRCGSYTAITRAIKRAAKQMQG